MSDIEDSDNTEEYRLSLDTLPVEVILYICSFLNANDVLNSLRLVCKRLNEIVSDESYWTTWMKHRWPSLRLPALDISNEGKNVSLKTVCYHIDKELQLWSGSFKRFKKLEFTDYHIAHVDSVKLFQNSELLITGSRDRNIAIWSVKDGVSTNRPLKVIPSAHDGWIWGISIAGVNRFYSASWDSKIRLWDIESEVLNISSFKCPSAVLDIAIKDNMVAAGLFSPVVHVFDGRKGDCPVSTYTAHKQAVMAIEFCGDYIVTASEDRTVSVFDLRAGSVYKHGVHLNSNSRAYPKSMHFDHNLFYVGDSKGSLHIFSTINSSFEFTESFDNIGHKSMITSIWHSLGCIITGSCDKSVRIFSPTSPPSLIADYVFNGEVSSLDYVNSVLAVGGADNIEVWVPNFGEESTDMQNQMSP